MQPALFYAHHSNTFEIRDVYHRMNGMMGGVSQMRNFLFRCADYKIWLNNWGFGGKEGLGPNNDISRHRKSWNDLK